MDPPRQPDPPGLDGALPASLLRALLASSAEMITLSDRAGRIIFASPATEQVSGYSVAEFLAVHPFEWIHPDDRPACEAALARLLATPGLRLELQHRVQHKDGTWRWVEGSFTSLFDDPAVNGLLAIVRDITARKQAEEALRASEARQAFLLALGDRVREAGDAAAIAAGAVEALGEHLGVARCLYGEVDPSGGTLCVEHDWTDGSLPGMAGCLRFEEVDTLLMLCRSGETVVVSDSGTDQRSAGMAAADAGSGAIRAAIGVPLFKGGRLTAAFCIHHTRPRQWSAGEVALVEDVARRTWTAIERTRAELALDDSQKFVQGVITSLPMAIYIFDFRKRSNVYLSPQALEMFGYSAEEMQASGTDLLPGFFHPDDLPRLNAYFEQIGRSAVARISSIECRIRHKRRGWIWVICRDIVYARDALGKPTQLLGTAEDITERKQAEAALRASEERLRVLVESVTDYAIFTLDPDGRVTSWNEGARRLKGYASAEILGRPVEGFYTAEDIAAGTPAREMARALADGRAEDESWRVRKDGTRFWGNEVMTPLIAADGTHLGFTKITRDVTARRQAEQALVQAFTAEQQARAAEQEARVELEDISRLKDDFLATVSHELRTPITALLGYAYLLSARADDAGYVAQTADKIVRSAKAQATLVEDLLDVSRAVSGTLRVVLGPLDLLPVVQAAIDTVRPAIESKGVQLRTALSRTGTMVLGDDQRLQQVAWNIVSNAVKFTPGGGRIDVELQPLDGHLQLVVRDTGQGIRASFLPHVFERFRQQDASSTRAAGGLGLGLAIVRQLVELHGGTIEIHSAGEGRGTTVRVVLPRLAAEDSTGAEQQHRARAAANGRVAAECPPELAGLRVLVVDDQAEIGALLDQTLSACGAEVRTHTGATAALAELRAWQPDVLIADIAMPKHDGYWLIAEVRALPPARGGSTPALALTAYVRIEDRLRVLHAGYQLFVPKPVEPAELRASVARLVGMHAHGE